MLCDTRISFFLLDRRRRESKRETLSNWLYLRETKLNLQTSLFQIHLGHITHFHAQTPQSKLDEPTVKSQLSLHFFLQLHPQRTQSFFIYICLHSFLYLAVCFFKLLLRNQDFHSFDHVIFFSEPIRGCLKISFQGCWFLTQVLVHRLQQGRVVMDNLGF